MRRNKKNLARQKALRIAVKKYKRLVSAGNPEEAKKYLPALYKTIDKAAKTNVIKKGKADRLKSRLSKKSAKR